MKAETVDITVSQLQEDLANCLTWLKKDDMGYGSIQEKYSANDIQVMTIMKHPKLVGLTPTTKIFRIVDDTETHPIMKSDKDGNYITEELVTKYRQKFCSDKEEENKEAGEALLDL